MEKQEHSLANGVLSSPNRHRGCPIEGMESVVATVSGYHGTERFNLIKMISYTGASYVGAMSRSITHLICWELEGRKFNLAKKFKTIIVNHRWLEDCIKQGKRVPEGPYILQSGQSAGPLSLKLPLADKGSVSTKKYNVLSEKLHNGGNVEDQICSFGDSFLPHSCLLDKDLYSDFRKSDETARRPKHKLRKKISKQEDPSSSSSRNHFKEPTPSGFFAMERGSSSSLARDERKGENSNQNPTVKSSRRRRRLVNKNSSEDHNEPGVWNIDPECYHLGTRNHGNNSLTVSSSHWDDETDIEVVNIGGTSDRDQLCDWGRTSDSFEGLEACENQSTSRDTNLPVENPPRILTITSEDELHNINDLQKNMEDPVIELNASVPSTSAELSCVICWTDFSSTRGVLPCGHRFCYSCIQNWADHMASSRKISTCPLCKASFLSITKVEDAATSDQKIYSQTIPCGPSLLDIYILPDERTLNSSVQHSAAASVCSACRCREPEDLLMSCHLCQIRHIHSYCLDPPLLPWTCIHCKDLQTLYHRSH